MTVKFIYELTKKSGANLYEALEKRHFDDYFIRESECTFEEADIHQPFRPQFIDWLMKNVSAKAWQEIKESIGGGELANWLLQNHLPDREDGLRRKYADDKVSYQLTLSVRNAEGAYQPLSLGHLDLNDDVQIALFFGLITYPKRGACGCYIQGRSDQEIPIDTAYQILAWKIEAKRIQKITGRGSGCPAPKDDLELRADEKIEALRNQAAMLEKITVRSLIRLKGFECKICMSEPKFQTPISKYGLIVCPTCKHPVCPHCANVLEKDPATVGEALVYLKGVQGGMRYAYCGNCGDRSIQFVLQFLKLKKCPIPDRFQFKPQNAVYVASAKVLALNDFQKIKHAIKSDFDQGLLEIASYSHKTGEIWGIPEYCDDGWIVTLCYARE